MTRVRILAINGQLILAHQSCRPRTLALALAPGNPAVASCAAGLAQRLSARPCTFSDLAGLTDNAEMILLLGSAAQLPPVIIERMAAQLSSNDELDAVFARVVVCGSKNRIVSPADHAGLQVLHDHRLVPPMLMKQANSTHPIYRN